MIYQIMKRDPAWKTAPYYLALFGAGAAYIEAGRSIVLMPLAMALVAAASGAGQAQERSKSFFAALPVTRREIFVARVGALMALIWAPALFGAAICSVTGRFGTEALIGVGAIVTPLVLIHQSVLIREIPVPVWTTGLAAAGLCAVSSFGMAYFTDLRGFPFGPAIAGGMLVSAVVLVYTWNALPHVGAPAVAAPTAVFDAGRRRAASTGRFPIWLFSWWDLIWFAVLFNMTFVGPWFSAVLFLWAGMIQSRERSRFLDSLPVSRRLLLAARVVLLLTPLVAGHLAGVNLGLAGTDPWNKVYISAGRQWPPTKGIDQCGTLNVTPPLEYWRPASPATSPIAQAPWGETYQTPVLRVYGYEVYNPYGVGCGNSKRFFDWQYERASLAVYGNLMPRNDARVRAPVRLRTVILNIGGILTCGLLAMLPLFVLDWWRFQRLGKPVRYVFFGITLAAYFGIVFSRILWPVTGDGSLSPANAMQVLSWVLPDSLAAITAICIAVPAALYFLTQRLVLASEAGTWEPGRKL